MRIVTVAAALIVLMAATAAAQSNRIYVSGQTAINAGSRGPIDVDAFPTLGGLVGLRIYKGWSIEFEVDRGFGRSPERVFDGLLLTQISTPGPWTPEERARLGVFGRSVHSSSVGVGYSAHVVWASRDPGRVNAAFMGGVSVRHFERVRAVEITSIGADVTYPPGHPNITDRTERRDAGGAGFAAGVMLPVRVGRSLTLAPELRFTLGLITDESTYLVVHTGARLMWGF